MSTKYYQEKHQKPIVSFPHDLANEFLPNFTFPLRIHSRPTRTFKISGKIFHITERTNDPKRIGRMFVGHNDLLHLFNAGLRTPDHCCGDPEQLPAVVFDAGQLGFVPVLSYPFIVSLISLFYAAIVGYVFSLSVNAV